MYFGYNMTNLALELKNIIDNIDVSKKPNLFLHVCCCPCSSHIIIKLIKYFHIYIIFYNPNIDTKEEFEKRLNELKRFLSIIKSEDADMEDIPILYEDYVHKEFLDAIKGYENEKEGGKRCDICFDLRLKHSYDIAKKYIKKQHLANNYLCTSLSTSPHKNASLIYQIGANMQDDDIIYLPSDFKKNDGYLDSIKLCEKYDIYRQKYCGCEFSKEG